MEFIRNFPLFAIILSFVSVVLCSLLPKKGGRIVSIIGEICAIILNACVIFYTYKYGPDNYAMGHFPAPFDNEIRLGVLEGILATLFPALLLLSLLSGVKNAEKDIPESKQKYLYVLLNLVQVALISLVYTNDIFTGYVFLEISTLSSVGLVMIKEKGHTIAAAVRYLIFNLVGSGLFLIGCVLLYALTGYLSMEFIMKELKLLVSLNQSMPAITCTFALITIGLGIKSGLFPFYFWMPDTYGESTTTSACVVSGLISKGYIFLLIKFIYRTFSWDAIIATNMHNVLFALGVAGMILGSISAIQQKKINRMVAFSSAAQIGYIYMGIGLGPAGMVASLFQVICHAITKPMLFASTSGLIAASDNKQDFKSLQGAGKRNIIAGIGFFVGSLSMVGFPITGGFIMKYLYINEIFANSLGNAKTWIAVSALVISTLLNTIYFLRTMMTIYQPAEHPVGEKVKMSSNISLTIAIILFVALNVIIGCIPGVFRLIQYGLKMF